METICELEEYVRVVLEIPYVCFDKVDMEVCKVIINTIEEMFQKYPFLKHTLSAIGNKDFLHPYINLDIYADEKEWQENLVEIGKKQIILYHHPLEYIEVMAFFNSIPRNSNKKKYEFLGLCFGDFLLNNSLEKCNLILMTLALSKVHPSHCSTLRSVIYHEIGHLLDYLFSISSSETFKNLYENNKEEIEKNVSKYATVSEEEFLAEAFSEYHSTNDPNELVLNVMNIIEDAYKNDLSKKKNLNLIRHYKY